MYLTALPLTVHACWDARYAGFSVYEHVLVVQFDVLHEQHATFNKSVGASGSFDIIGMNRMKRANWMGI